MSHHETIEVECPACKEKTRRYKEALKVFAMACPNCKCVWKHPLMMEKELEDAKKN